MKCPKCGQEYEGSACPNCEPGPEIIVNNADYLRRKEAYEKLSLIHISEPTRH